jgi:hypothetical protein
MMSAATLRLVQQPRWWTLCVCCGALQDFIDEVRKEKHISPLGLFLNVELRDSGGAVVEVSGDQMAYRHRADAQAN